MCALAQQVHEGGHGEDGPALAERAEAGPDQQACRDRQHDHRLTPPGRVAAGSDHGEPGARPGVHSPRTG